MRLDAFPTHVVTPVGKRNDSKLCKLQEQEMPPHREAPYQSSSEAAFDLQTYSHLDLLGN